MPRYFFDVHDGVTTIDNLGSELVDLSAAREVATGILHDIALEFPANGSSKEHEVIVRAEDGMHLLKALMIFSCVEFASGTEPVGEPKKAIERRVTDEEFRAFHIANCRVDQGRDRQVIARIDAGTRHFDQSPGAIEMMDSTDRIRAERLAHIEMLEELVQM